MAASDLHRLAGYGLFRNRLARLIARLRSGLVPSGAMAEHGQSRILPSLLPEPRIYYLVDDDALLCNPATLPADATAVVCANVAFAISK